MKLYFRVLSTAAALVAYIGPTFAQPSPDARVADIVKSGKLRAGLFLSQYIKNPASAELSSVWVETARALASRIGVELVLVEHPTPPKAIECLKSQACDVIFLPFDARAANDGEFSSPFIQFEYTLLVPSGSPIRNVADAERPAIRIAAVRNHASTAALNQKLKQANVVYAETPEATFDLLRTGGAEAMASARNTLLGYSAQLPGSRVLTDHYGVNLNRIVVPKGHTGRLEYVSEFAEEAKASGFVQRAIERSGPRGIVVAPPGNSN